MTGDDIQVEGGGYVRVHHAILERLAVTELTGRQWRLLMALLRLTYGYNKKEDAISLAQWCELTGMKKSHASVSLGELIARKIIYRKDAGIGRGHVAAYGFNKYFEQWLSAAEAAKRLPQTTSKVTPDGNHLHERKVTPNAEKGYPKRPKKVTPDHEHPKDSKDNTKDKAAPPRAVRTAPPSAAVEAYRELHERYPTKPQMKLIDARVTDLDLWREALAAWAGHNYNSGNVQGMLDWYIDPARFRTRNAPGTGPPSRAELRAYNGKANVAEAFAELINMHAEKDAP